MGRYISEDPIGFGAGDENIYRYVQNDSINWIDSNGLNRAGRGTSRYRELQSEYNAFVEVEARMLVSAIREIEPNFIEPASIRSTTSPRYNRNDINALRDYYQRASACNTCNGQKRGPKTNPVAPHNAKIREIADQIEKEGEKIIAGGGRKPERLIPTFGGHKNGRRPDILYKDANGVTRGKNVGRVKADGTPVLREQKALDDLNGPGLLPTTFDCYYP